MTSPASRPPPSSGNELTLTRALAHARAAETAGTAAGARFQALLAEVEAARRRLAGWQDVAEAYHRARVLRWLPALRLRRERLREWVLAADRLLAADLGSRALRQRLQQRLLQRAQAWLAEGLDPQVEAIFDRFSSLPHHELRAAEMAETERVLAQVYGLQLPPGHGARSAGDMLAQAGRQAHAQREREAARKADRRAARVARREAAEEDDVRERRQHRQGDRDQAREAVAQALAQSVRSVFRKLASALHPDREPDAARRAHKTTLMQQANAAYEAADLLALLSLQWEASQLGGEGWNPASAPRLDALCEVLQDQLLELRDSLVQVQAPLLAARDAEPLEAEVAALPEAAAAAAVGTPAHDLAEQDGLRRWLAAQDLRHTRASEQVLHDLAMLQNPEVLRDWLREDEPPAADSEVQAFLQQAQAWEFLMAEAQDRRAGRRRQRR
ncbi:hypothetical protein [Ideonella livida]|uniref:J domain-containing protein n=1 Tax=Ideonella livida TaxID=2707176 RepID=A0A7C9PF32_9BURK|nr:hypothetical protein [Ideonella livida]NDY90108.1 hypothetical protein [Ideonella livida]